MAHVLPNHLQFTLWQVQLSINLVLVVSGRGGKTSGLVFLCLLKKALILSYIGKQLPGKNHRPQYNGE